MASHGAGAGGQGADAGVAADKARVILTHAQSTAEKYGLPGKTDNEGFDPYRDTVGPGIYGGIVGRNEDGEVQIGRQYQNHNTRPGPVYAGGGYTPIVQALGDDARVNALLDKYPDLVNDVSTGGAQPLHMCGGAGRIVRGTRHPTHFEPPSLESHGTL